MPIFYCSESILSCPPGIYRAIQVASQASLADYPCLQSVLDRWPVVNPGRFQLIKGAEVTWVLLFTSKTPGAPCLADDQTSNRDAWLNEALTALAEVPGWQFMASPDPGPGSASRLWLDFYHTVSLRNPITLIMTTDPELAMNTPQIYQALSLGSRLSIKDVKPFTSLQPEPRQIEERHRRVEQKLKKMTFKVKLKSWVTSAELFDLVGADRSAALKISGSEAAIGKTTLPEDPRYGGISLGLDAAWTSLFGDAELTSEYRKIQTKIKDDHGIVLPPESDRFNAFKYCSFMDLKVIIIGQDPYHGPGQAHGLSFSVAPGQRVPPSLVRIYKALIADPEIDFKGPGHGCLVEWAQQGVLMLNTALTVRQGEPNSHSGWWERWSDRLITLISQRAPQSIIFMLWGNHARKRARLIGSRHLILEYHHPSPLSQKDWSECRHFSQANKWLISQHQRPINWSLTPIT